MVGESVLRRRLAVRLVISASRGIQAQYEIDQGPPVSTSGRCRTFLTRRAWLVNRRVRWGQRLDKDAAVQQMVEECWWG